MLPKQRNALLKESKNLWFLHSADPLSVATSYSQLV
jgi:hypothetical protein